MNRFEYASPKTKNMAVRLLSQGAAILAGGTDLVSLMKERVIVPSRVVNIKEIRDLQGLEHDPGQGLRVGAVVTLSDLLANREVAENYPALVQAAAGVKSPQIRNLGTVGGDLCQRPRCWYFRKGFGLLGVHRGQSMVRDGDNRYHAILGNSGPACFVNPSSLAPALIALGARLKIYGPGGEREVEAEQFFQIPQSEAEKEYRLAESEIVTDILVPPAAGRKNATYEVRQSESLDWPLTAAAAVLEMNGEGVASARVVLGHVAPVPWVSPEAAQALVGKPVFEETAEAAGRAAIDKAVPLSRNQYKIRLARVAVKRAILRAAGTEV